MIISFLVQAKLNAKFEKYSKIKLKNGLSGKDIAKKMLTDYGIYDVEVICVSGTLTDHYNPLNKTVNLSESVYNNVSAAAAAVAAHECGHVLQHAHAYSMLQFRSFLVPIVQISSNLMQWVLMAGFTIMYTSNSTTILLIGIIMFAFTTLFSLVTLPVEYDASNRALKWFKENNMVTIEEYANAKDSLNWAARTYLVAALGSIAQLFYFIKVFTDDRRD